MTTDDILRMAREAGKYADEEYARRWETGEGGSWSWIRDERFAALVAAAEREECAKVAKAISDKYAIGYYGNEVDTADEIEAAIRARGKT